MDCLISVVIPCFNAGGCLAGAVQSVLDQSVPETEVLIVDDASTDDSAAVAEALARQHQEVCVLRQLVNRGSAAGRILSRGLLRKRILAISHQAGQPPGLLPRSERRGGREACLSSSHRGRAERRNRRSDSSVFR